MIGDRITEWCRALLSMWMMSGKRTRKGEGEGERRKQSGNKGKVGRKIGRYSKHKIPMVRYAKWLNRWTKVVSIANEQWQ
jgi:hypothetical protein